jgi:hypothetical protein
MRRFLIIILVIILVIAGVWFFYIRPRELTGQPVPNVLRSFFPTSTTNTGSFGTDTTSGLGTNGGTNIAATSAFKEMTGSPVAGYTIFSITDTVTLPTTNPSAYVTPATTAASTTSTTTPVSSTTTKTKPVATKPVVVAKPVTQTVIDHMIRYVSRGNGYVYEIKDGGIPLQISNIYIPNIYEAFFADNNTTAILRFLRSDYKTIATYSVPIPPLNTDGTRTQKSGIYLPDNISEIAVSPDGSEIARVTTDTTGAIITTSNTGGATIKTIARSPFTEWIPMWAGNTVYIQTKAASIANGYLYSINSSNTRLQRVVGDVPGLTTSISPSGTYVLYSQSTPTGFVTSLLDTKTGIVSPISLAILPEKCTWLQNEDLICAGNSTVPSGTYPDDWYAGTMHFSDQLYHIYTGTNTYTVLYNGQAQSFDMTNLQVDEGQQFVYFIDKNTGLLWQFNYGQ